jgi:plasmid maintenance system antidote protein VapI
MRLMFNPPRPGITLRDDILPALNPQVGEAAEHLVVDQTNLSKVLNGRAAIWSVDKISMTEQGDWEA